MQMKIRPYEERDKENVRFVCLNSEGPCTLHKDTQDFILTTYCDYYLEREPQNCYVLADESDRAVGYIICAEDFDAFYGAFLEGYVTRFSPADTARRSDAAHSVDLQNKYKKTYPAHMHIDILPQYQRSGWGGRLVDTLAAHLRRKGVCGLMLTVGSDNAVGRGFYRKYGFALLEEATGEAAYGIPL